MKFWPKGNEAASPAAETPDERTPEVPDHRRAEASRWVGYIDKIDRGLILGWCFDRDHPDQSLAVEALGSSGNRVVVIACLFRQDVRDGGYGSGHHGFEIDLSAFDDAESVVVRFADSLASITPTPIALDPISALCTNALPERFAEAARQLASDVGTRHALWQRRDPRTRSDDDAPYDARLLATFDPRTDPEGLVTRFTAQESTRIARDAFELRMSGSLQERLGVLFWFVDTYAATRPSAAKVPLSANQIEALNAPARIAGASDAVTVALQNFVLRHLPTHADLRDDGRLIEAVYWWCVERAPRTQLADRLVTREQVELLSAPSRGAGTRYPCTMFMTMYAERHPDLRDLDLDLPRDRLALLSYLVLASFLEPHLLQFLPREILGRLSRVTDTGHRPIDLILGRLAASGGDRQGPALGRETREQGEELLTAAHLRFRSRRPIPRPEAARTERSNRNDGRPGLGIIGPYSKSSGLGRAMRLSLETAETIEPEPPAPLDFAMEHPGPSGGSMGSRYATLDHAREITLIHFNAEMLPLVFAYGPRRSLAGSYCIGFPFWELNELAECQRFALDLVDEIWVASEYNREIFARHTTKPVIRVGMAALSLPSVSPASRQDFGLAPDAFVFVASFDSLSFIARKNPVAVVESFRRAFPLGSEPVQLLIKTQNRGRVSDGLQVRTWQRIDRALAADPRIVLMDETLPFAELLALIRACDAYVSLHRSEGWGFGLVEAMQLGLPVICTGYSGNADFCTPQTAFLVDHGLISVAPDEYIYVPRGSVWADPSIASAAAHMRHVVADRAAGARKAEAARAFVESELSLIAVGKRYAQRLAAIRGERDGRAAT